MTWLAYALATPVLYCVAVFIDKIVLGKKISDPLIMTLLSGAIMGLMGISFALFFGLKDIGFIQTLALIASGVLALFYILPYFYALRLDDASRIVPLFQLSPLYVLIFSSLFLHEVLSGKQLIGFFLILAGSFLISAQKLESGFFKLRPAFWYMALAGLMYAGVGLLFRYVVREESFWTTATYQFMGSGLATFPLILFLHSRGSLSRHIGDHKPVFILITFSNLLAALALLSQSFALSLASTPLVYIVAGIQPFIMLLFTFISTLWIPHVLREDTSRLTVFNKLFSIFLIFSGLYFIYL